MYSTSIRDNRFQIECIAVSNKIRSAKFIVDTGAKFTCCHYTLIDWDICEENLLNNEMIGGFVKGLPVKFYKYSLNRFTIGNIDLGEQSLWITFDERITDTVLGMDILQQIIFTAIFLPQIHITKRSISVKTVMIITVILNF